MPAGVVERADHVVLAADDDDGSTRPADDYETAGLRDLLGMTDIQPAFLPQVLALESQNIWVDITARGNVGQPRKTLRRGRASGLVFHAFQKAPHRCRVHGPPVDCRDRPTTRRRAL